MGVGLNTPISTALVKRLPSFHAAMGSTPLRSHLQTQEPSSTTLQRWNTRECYEELHNRPWAEVLEFYSLVAVGKLSFSDLTFHNQWTGTQEEKKSSLSSFSVHSKANSERLRGGKWLRKTFKIVLSYDGSAFMGWQKQPGLHTVQGLVEKALGRFVDGKRAKALEAQGEHVDANVTVAGRTDKGVHAIGQVCSFYTWRQEVDEDEIRAAINAMAPKSLKVVNVEEVRREFHPNFSAKRRCYIYLLPLHDNEWQGFPLYGSKGPTDSGFENGEAKKEAFIPDGDCRCIDVEAVDGLLRQLEARTLSYTAFARDTQKSRSNGPTTECTIYRAQAVLAELPEVSNKGRRRKVICIQLVADRFLRKMVRVLVATVVREAMAGAASDSLFQLLQGTSRRASAPPAPPFGLCLAHVGYEDDDQFQCFLFGPN